MKLYYFGILLLVVISTTHSKKVNERDDEKNTLIIDVSSKWENNGTPSSIDLKGRLRRVYAINLAISNPDKSVVCSPVSALLPLAKLALGSVNLSRRRLLTAIGLRNKSKIKDKFKTLLKELTKLPGVTLNVVSKIYLSLRDVLKSQFQYDSQEIFQSSVEKVDFANPRGAVKAINNWVNAKTNGMIKEILTTKQISPQSSLVLVNAVYFSGAWKYPFKKVNNSHFYTAYAVRKIPLMTTYAEFKYTDSAELNAKVIEIPYEGEQASLVIILPNEKDGLSLLLKKLQLAPDLMQDAMSKLVYADIELTLPKFKITTEIDLKESYTKLGLEAIFKANSELTNIVFRKEVHVSTAVQKAMINVHEYGTEAAAATAVNVALKAPNLESVLKFRADHPFYFIVKENQEQLFAGTFTSF